MVKKGTWVSVRRTVLSPEGRAATVPDDTKQVALVLLTSGYLQADANIGDNVQIITHIGRADEGELVEANPIFNVNYGHSVPILNQVRDDLLKLMEDIDNE